LPELNSEQWASLLELINSHKANSTENLTGKSKTTAWILDTGASNHMTGNVENLHNLKEISACLIGLPNVSQVLAVNEGSIKLDENLALSNVLYVPGLTCNLIFVSQIVNEIDCVVVFSKHVCALQDRTSKTLIGAGERQDGLYYFRKKPGIKVHKVTGVDSLNLWHASWSSFFQSYQVGSCIRR